MLGNIFPHLAIIPINKLVFWILFCVLSISWFCYRFQASSILFIFYIIYATFGGFIGKLTFWLLEKHTVVDIIIYEFSLAASSTCSFYL